MDPQAATPEARRARRVRKAPLVERRFPLHLAPVMPTIRDLYDAAKAAHWDPEKHIAWRDFDGARYSKEQRAAAALSWSRRAWTEYGGLPETPAILIRFCLDHKGESDPKMFLSVRGSEEAWHTECCWRFAALLHGYVDTPPDARYAALFNQDVHREAFDPGLSVDAYMVVHAILLDGIDLELHRGFLRNAVDPIARSILKRLVQDKERHATFGWAYLAGRAASWTGVERSEIDAELAQGLAGFVHSGYVCAWLASDNAGSAIVEADRITREAGLGAMTAEEERAVLTLYLAEARAKLAEYDLHLSDQLP